MKGNRERNLRCSAPVELRWQPERRYLSDYIAQFGHRGTTFAAPTSRLQAECSFRYGKEIVA